MGTVPGEYIGSHGLLTFFAELFCSSVDVIVFDFLFVFSVLLTNAPLVVSFSFTISVFSTGETIRSTFLLFRTGVFKDLLGDLFFLPMSKKLKTVVGVSK